MAIDMKVPSVGESVTEVTIAAWVKKDGDFVKMDEVICELESDKATFELPAEADGILHIIGKEGDTLKIGAAICSIEPQNAASTEKSEPLPLEVRPAVVSDPVAHTVVQKSEVLEIKVPTVGESITEVTIASWLKKTGDQVGLDEIICELESDKATFELPSPFAGTLTIKAEEGTVVPIGGVLAAVAVGGSTVAPKEAKGEVSIPTTVQTAENATYAEGHPSPAAAKVMAEKGLASSDVNGTGVGGRITKEDALNAKAAPTPSVTPKSEPNPSVVAPKEDRGSRREKMTSLRKTIARRLVAVKNETAMLTTFNEVDMKPIMDLRKQYKDKFKDIHGVGLGFMSFFTKACSIALLEFPAVNAFIDGEEIVYNDFTDISIAVSAPRGLVVPVIRNAEKMNFAQIESEVVRLALKARDNKLTIDEMTGGTFTITNGGIFGSMLSTPIINAPQSAILGMHNIVERPVAINGSVEIRPIMYVALSYDHRTIDGKDSVSFLVRVKQLLEDPMRMLLQV
ncbi:2-oxoglutarate dehydrogenase complex dihydrolipoyllysine-residue succinyltransferase [Lacihabitans sp. LS3-19]|uniref:2-oxoglutarate dehydrogenase complex dihydrolipoyllysine-residue succinyltransferase n=1 Tax=Lacihabitans sp. LS3-19 TaxID=2487335 RepID=UPI0020CE34C3|nr:2-oxoglutarate dehydrogenase complex dihydrolipoyllysine-residue succinyltransferase [Lacihabitans sp. LS3-19]MCP9769666.1 2-oxoglutarate dehydrogenase complex dihydrolipoyllysine-residue succinyltransferase [Lacihabitans sp. LS3-19]